MAEIPSFWPEDFSGDEPELPRSSERLLKIQDALSDHQTASGRLDAVEESGGMVGNMDDLGAFSAEESGLCTEQMKGRAEVLNALNIQYGPTLVEQTDFLEKEGGRNQKEQDELNDIVARMISEVEDDDMLVELEIDGEVVMVTLTEYCEYMRLQMDELLIVDEVDSGARPETVEEKALKAHRKESQRIMRQVQKEHGLQGDDDDTDAQLT